MQVQEADSIQKQLITAGQTVEMSGWLGNDFLSAGRFMMLKGTVSDDAIIKAISTLGSHEGIFCEPAAAAAYAGLEKALDTKIIKKDENVSVILTGNGLKDPDTITGKLKDPLKISNDLKALISHMEHDA